MLPTEHTQSHYAIIKRMAREVPDRSGWDLFFNMEIEKESKKRLMEEGFNFIRLGKINGVTSYKIKLPK